MSGGVSFSLSCCISSVICGLTREAFVTRSLLVSIRVAGPSARTLPLERRTTRWVAFCYKLHVMGDYDYCFPLRYELHYEISQSIFLKMVLSNCWFIHDYVFWIPYQSGC